jgi:hypothetical protein
MAISHSAISRKGFLLGLLLIFVSIFSAAANSFAKSAAAPVSNLHAASHQNYQDKTKKTEHQETQKPEAQRVDPDKQGPQKPEIKEVPKARKQLKPAAVKPKVKPIRIVKPKIKKH